jgi:hypothetical protein
VSPAAEFADACRAEWERLGVARDRLAVMRRELDEALAEAPDGELPDEIGGRPTDDPRAFADAWAAEHGATRAPLRYTGLGGRPGLRAGVAALALLLVVGVIAAILEFRAPDDPNATPGSEVQPTLQGKADLVVIPNLVGSPLEVATQTAQKQGLRIGDVVELADAHVEKGTVLKVQPRPGTKLPRDRTLTLTVAK